MGHSPNSDLPDVEAPEARLLASMGHSFRTPLNQILGFAELLSEELSGPLNDKQRSQALGISRAGDRLLSVVNDLLLFAELRAKRVTTEGGQSDIAEALRLVQSTPDASEGAAVTVESHDEAVSLCALDAEWLGRLVDTLVGPARLLARPDRPVSVRYGVGTSNPPSAWLEVTSDFGDSSIATCATVDLVQFSTICEKLVHGTGVQLLLANQIAASVGGSLTVSVPDESDASYVVRCTLPRSVPLHESSGQAPVVVGVS